MAPEDSSSRNSNGRHCRAQAPIFEGGSATRLGSPRSPPGRAPPSRTHTHTHIHTHTHEQHLRCDRKR
eukprot:15472604-Alexandrium_andersonii.AAC.1